MPKLLKWMFNLTQCHSSCNQDPDILGANFDNVISTWLAQRYFVNLYVFKFYNSDDVFFKCTVKVCPDNSFSCDINCSRKRRSIVPEPSNDSDKVFTTTNTIHILPVGSTGPLLDTSNPNNVSDGVNNAVISGGYDPVVVIDRWPNISDVDLEQKTRAVKALSERHDRQKREVSCNKQAVLNIVPYYDDAFFSRFGAGSEDRIRAVMAVMQVFMELDSLKFQVNGHVIESFQLNIMEIKRISGIFSSDDVPDLDGFGAVVEADTSMPTAHHYMLFTSQNNQGGVVGIAWLGSICAFSWSFYQTSVVEYWYNDALTGEIAAHELGHSLGADHDFIDATGGSRYDSNGNTCTNIEGIMDYVNNPTRWTTCSNEDFEATFSAWGLCFPLEDTCTTTTPTTTTISPTSKTTPTTTKPTTTTTTTTTTSPTSSTTVSTTTTPTTTTTTQTSTTTTPTTTTTTQTSKSSSTTPTTTAPVCSCESFQRQDYRDLCCEKRPKRFGVNCCAGCGCGLSSTTTTPTTTTVPTSTTTSTPSSSTTISTASTTTAPVCSCESFERQDYRDRCCERRPKRFGVNCCAGCGCR